ncbi:MAG: hypothetical protein V3V15_01550 [Sphingorhabdus sp.]
MKQYFGIIILGAALSVAPALAGQPEEKADKAVMAQSAETSGAVETAATTDVSAENNGSAQPVSTEKVESKPVAVFYMRSSVVPRAGDEAPLKKGLSLMIASSRGGMTIVEYGVKDGQIIWKATSGKVDKKTAKQIDKAVAKLQKKM